MVSGSAFAYGDGQFVTAQEVTRALRDGDPGFVLLLKHFVTAADPPALIALRDELMDAARDVLPELS